MRQQKPAAYFFLPPHFPNNPLQPLQNRILGLPILSRRAEARDLLHAGATLSATARRLRQTPLMHCTPGEQRWLHAPQVAGSLFRSLQTPLQQAALPPGAVPHCPQLAGSLGQFTHPPLQQYWPLRQLFEQLPQKEQDVPCPPRSSSRVSTRPLISPEFIALRIEATEAL
jgi:hypothetical protein